MGKTACELQLCQQPGPKVNAWPFQQTAFRHRGVFPTHTRYDCRTICRTITAKTNTWDLTRTNKFVGWVKERLTGLNSHVRYVHYRFMLIDPFGNDPIVVGGSANFSKASTEENDENILVVRGDKRVADIYLGEFMRLYSHHAFRESMTFRDQGRQSRCGPTTGGRTISVRHQVRCAGDSFRGARRE